MTLSEYIAAHGTAAKRAIADRTGLRWATIHDIARGTQRPQPDTALAIEAATGGAVTAVELLGLPARPSEDVREAG